MLDKYDMSKIDLIEYNGIFMIWLYFFGFFIVLLYCIIYWKDSYWCCVIDWGKENYIGFLLFLFGLRIIVYLYGYCVYRLIIFIFLVDWSYYFMLFNFICKIVFVVCK